MPDLDDLSETDRQRLHAGLDLIGRTGAADVVIGYLHDDVPPADADWYAHANYLGSRITHDHAASPVAAVEGLVSRLLDGGRCAHCGRLTTTNPFGVPAGDRVLVDGTPWSGADQVRAGGTCLWAREGDTWTAQCQRAKPTTRCLGAEWRCEPW